MLKEHGFYKGVNLGGWMSQCDYSEARLDGFITEPDFAQIAAWGFDHVRLPVDYNVIQNRDGSMKPEGLARVDRAVALCEKYGLRVVLDLHKTQREKFYAVWECFAARYGAMSERVVFDLLNEMTEKKYLEGWKSASRECVRRIRRFAPETDVLLGSWLWNNARTLPDLDAPYDGHVVYNFHFYEPHIFTHQGAYWMGPDFDRARRVSYAESGATEAWIEDYLAPAIEKAEKEGAELYCGEFGVIDVVPPEEAMGWYRALLAVFRRHGIAHSLWSYKQMDFGLCDARMDGVREELLELL